MSALGPSLQQGIKWLVVSIALLTREGKDEVMEACVAYSVLDNIRETVVPRSGTAKVSSTFESVGLKLKANRELN